MTAGRLFVYGTLRRDALVASLTGRRLPRRAAHLSGWARVDPPGAYPYLVPQPDSTVDGILLDDVDDAAFARLDAYEGELYVRRRLTVHVDGTAIEADVYLGDAAGLEALSRRARGRA